MTLGKAVVLCAGELRKAWDSDTLQEGWGQEDSLRWQWLSKAGKERRDAVIWGRCFQVEGTVGQGPALSVLDVFSLTKMDIY